MKLKTISSLYSLAVKSESRYGPGLPNGLSTICISASAHGRATSSTLSL